MKLIYALVAAALLAAGPAAAADTSSVDKIIKKLKSPNKVKRTKTKRRTLKVNQNSDTTKLRRAKKKKKKKRDLAVTRETKPKASKLRKIIFKKRTVKRKPAKLKLKSTKKHGVVEWKPKSGSNKLGTKNGTRVSKRVLDWKPETGPTKPGKYKGGSRVSKRVLDWKPATKNSKGTGSAKVKYKSKHKSASKRPWLPKTHVLEDQTAAPAYAEAPATTIDDGTAVSGVNGVELTSAQKQAVADVLSSDVVPKIDFHIQFEFNSSEIVPTSLPTIIRLARALRHKELAADSFLLIGHTDAVGSDAYNQTLSELRAQSVRRMLTESFGVSPERLVAFGYGEKYLKTPGDPTGAVNRRVQVVNMD